MHRTGDSILCVVSSPTLRMLEDTNKNSADLLDRVKVSSKKLTDLLENSTCKAHLKLLLVQPCTVSI